MICEDCKAIGQPSPVFVVIQVKAGGRDEAYCEAHWRAYNKSNWVDTAWFTTGTAFLPDPWKVSGGTLIHGHTKKESQ